MSKKSEQINIAVTPDLLGRVEQLEGRTGIKGTEMGRIGLVEVVNRLEQHGSIAAPLGTEVGYLAAELRRLGGDPEQALRDAIAHCPLQPAQR